MHIYIYIYIYIAVVAAGVTGLCRLEGSALSYVEGYDIDKYGIQNDCVGR